MGRLRRGRREARRSQALCVGVPVYRRSSSGAVADSDGLVVPGWSQWVVRCPVCPRSLRKALARAGGG